ncbi:MAG: hypothetical protein Q8R30_05635, partial [bacterium]|nr:hypothetical protein [bacterium]
AYQYAVSANFGPWNKIECSAPPISLPKHMGCNGDKCEMIAGSGSATCSGNENCGANAKHLGCADQKCAYVSGSGTNDCAEGDDPVCKKRNTHKICASVGQCIEVDGPGPNICNTNPDCKAGGTTGSGIDIIDNVGLANELRAAGIGLSNSASCSGASARTNFDELQNGQPLTVCHSGCSTDGIACQQKGNTVLPQMLIDLKNLKQGQNLNFQINSLMTGDHGPNSDHYQGKGVDLKPLLGTTYQQLYDAINQEKNLRGNIRLVQCENESGKVDCTKGSPNHIHISYKYKL